MGEVRSKYSIYSTKGGDYAGEVIDRRMANIPGNTVIIRSLIHVRSYFYCN